MPAVKSLLFGTAALFGVGLVAIACSSEANSNPNEAADAGTPSEEEEDSGGGTTKDGGESKYMPDGFTQVPFLSTTPKHEFTKAEEVLEADMDYIAVLETDVGRLTLDLFESDTPTTVNSFVFLALNHFYEGIAFHRVIDEFMAQTGDPNSLDRPSTTWGAGGCGYEFGLEVKPNLRFDGAGVVGMARAQDPSTNGSQFFITFEATASLNDQYTVWGKVIEGLDVLPKIVRGEPPDEPSRIEEIRIGVKAK